jgi:lia operon protein LiaF
MTGNRRVWWGVILIVIGLLFLLANTDLWDVRDIVDQFWPLLLIILGVALLLRRGHWASHTRTAPAWKSAEPSATTGAEERVHSSNVFGDVELRVTSQNFRGGNVSTVFGSVRVDCSSAALAEGESELSMSGVFGEVNLILPKDAAFAVRATTLFGSVSLDGERREGFAPTLVKESPDYVSAPRRLKLRVSQVFGEAEISH